MQTRFQSSRTTSNTWVGRMVKNGRLNTFIQNLGSVMTRVGRRHLIGIWNINRNCSFVEMEWAIWALLGLQIVCLSKLSKVYVPLPHFPLTTTEVCDKLRFGWLVWFTAHEWSSSSLRSWRYSLCSILSGASIGFSLCYILYRLLMYQPRNFAHSLNKLER